VLQKEDTDWVKKCMEYQVEDSRPRGRPKRTWREVVQKDCQACNLNREDAMDRGRWKKQIKIGRRAINSCCGVASQQILRLMLLLVTTLVAT